MEELRKWLAGEHGRASLLAAALKITPGAISQWKDVPPARVLDIERITGISRHALRPDVFGAPDGDRPTPAPPKHGHRSVA